MKTQIYGITWDLYVLGSDEYVRRFGDDTEGLTFPETKQIYFNEDCFNRQLVKHEVIHAYINSKHLNSASLTVEQLEEVFAEMFSEHGSRILKHAGQIYRELKDD